MMTERIAFLREQTLKSLNKTARRSMPADWSTADAPVSLPERKALALKKIFDEMPLFIGEQELIVGTRTLYKPADTNTDDHNVFEYRLETYPRYVTDAEIEAFGKDCSFFNKTHYTPDFGILLHKGVSGIIAEAEARKADPALAARHIEFLNSVIIAYTGLQNLISRYADLAASMAADADGEERARLDSIAACCRKLVTGRPETFREAVQLLWFGHLGTILESFMFICYGRLDVLLGEFLGDTPHDAAEELLECLLLKMYDQADIIDGGYFNKHEGQLVVTLGGVTADGGNAVNDVTMLFLDAIDAVRLPEPEFNLRISRKNPPEFLDRAARLTVSGCNFISYYNDDLFVDAMVGVGIPAEEARLYGFDLCQDINIPGRGDFYNAGTLSLSHGLMTLLKSKSDFASFDELLSSYKELLADTARQAIERFNAGYDLISLYRDGKYDEYFAHIREQGATSWAGRHPMAPLPFLSALYHGTIEQAMDMIYDPMPVKAKGTMIGCSVEAINSLAAIKSVVYDRGLYTLPDVVQACIDDFRGEGQEIMRRILWNAPKWGNDDPYVDEIAKDVLEFGMREFAKYRTNTGDVFLTGIHQPHPVATGWGLMAMPEGRHDKTPAAVTLTPESGTMKNGATAALKSASIFDTSLIQWNFCVMVNYYASVFEGNGGHELFKKLLTTYFADGGMQHQPNVMDAAQLRQAQIEPEKYKDLIVRLWGVSAHFVDLPRELQDEMIARLA
ncbi:MAG: hypothetical protein E7463_07635 [Ruminococcaceae bacterium]|nr:hypothetical protein [Oscillospiraceae bacterium]